MNEEVDVGKGQSLLKWLREKAAPFCSRIISFYWKYKDPFNLGKKTEESEAPVVEEEPVAEAVAEEPVVVPAAEEVPVVVETAAEPVAEEALVIVEAAAEPVAEKAPVVVEAAAEPVVEEALAAVEETPVKEKKSRRWSITATCFCVWVGEGIIIGLLGGVFPKLSSFLINLVFLQAVFFGFTSLVYRERRDSYLPFVKAAGLFLAGVVIGLICRALPIVIGDMVADNNVSASVEQVDESAPALPESAPPVLEE